MHVFIQLLCSQFDIPFHSYSWLFVAGSDLAYETMYDDEDVVGTTQTMPWFDPNYLASKPGHHEEAVSSYRHVGMGLGGQNIILYRTFNWIHLLVYVYMLCHSFFHSRGKNCGCKKSSEGRPGY